jgi:S-adenosylmethionine synthetase
VPFYIAQQGIRPSRVDLVYKDIPLDLPHEIIECKGKGHPDTIADTLAARISRAYSRYTVRECDGLILHHQIDKLMILGGKADVWWGNGYFIEPIKIIVAGRASHSYKGKQIPVKDLVTETIFSYFKEEFPLVDVGKDLRIQLELSSSPGPGTIRFSTGAIAHMFMPTSPETVRGYEELVSNDTSYCVGFFPFTRLEQAVLTTEASLNSRNFKIQYPWLGSDIKLMAVKTGHILDITACIPQIAAYVMSLEEYQQNLVIIGSEMLKILENHFDGQVEVQLSLNTKDNYQTNNVYLTVSGAPLFGDIGVVGRGNRANGIAVHLSVFEPGDGVLGNSSSPSFLSFGMEPTSSGCPERP